MAIALEIADLHPLKNIKNGDFPYFPIVICMFTRDPAISRHLPERCQLADTELFKKLSRLGSPAVKTLTIPWGSFPWRIHGAGIYPTW